MQVQGAAADLEADRDRQLVEFVQVLAVGEGGMSCMSSSSSCVEWSWQRGASFGEPQQRSSGRWPAGSSNRSPGSRVRSSPASSGRPEPLQATGAAHGQALRRGARRQACQQRRGIAVEPERQALVVAFQAQAQAHRSAWLRRAQPYQTRPGKTLAFALQQGQLRGRRQAGETAPPAGSARASGQRRGLAEKRRERPTPGSVRDRRRGRPGRCPGARKALPT